MGLLRQRVRNSSIVKESYKKESKTSRDYSTFWGWVIGISIFLGVWLFFTTIFWMVDRSSSYQPETRTLFQFIGAQWQWVKETVKHIF